MLFEARDYLSHDLFRVRQCQSCRLVETTPQPAPEDMARYYPDEYFGLSGRRFLGPGERLIRLARIWRAQAIHRVRRAAGRILDIGCGRGWMLTELKRMGWECYGTEWSETLVRRLRQNGLQMFHEVDLRNCRFPDRFFDVVTLWHVFEHVSNPTDTLAEIFRVVKSGGLIVIATPDFGGWVAQRTRQYWFALDVPRHLYHYSRDTLPALIESAGFHVLRRRNLSLEQDVFGLAQSFLNRWGFEHNRLYDAIRSDAAQLKVARSETLFARLHFWLAAVAALAPSLPAALLLSLLKTGGTIEVWATKPADAPPAISMT